MVKIINSLLPFTVEMCTLYPRILFGVLFQHFWSSFVYTVVCLFCNIACGSLIDSNLQNICHIFFKKYYLFAHTRWRRGCRLKVNVHVQRVQRGAGGEGEEVWAYVLYGWPPSPLVFSTSYLIISSRLCFLLQS